MKILFKICTCAVVSITAIIAFKNYFNEVIKNLRENPLLQSLSKTNILGIVGLFHNNIDRSINNTKGINVSTSDAGLQNANDVLNTRVNMIKDNTSSEEVKTEALNNIESIHDKLLKTLEELTSILSENFNNLDMNILD